MTVLPSMDGAALAHEFPASLGQTRELEAGHAFARVQVLRLRGPLDPQALERSFGILMRRHEVLRTVLRKKEGEWRQVVLDDPPSSLEVLDHSALPGDAEQESALRALGARLGGACAVPLSPALFRAALVKRHATEHTCVLAASSLVLDGFSCDLLLDDLVSIYAVETQAQTGPLREPEVQYADCVLWEAAMSAARGGTENRPAAIEDLSRNHLNGNGAARQAPAYVEESFSAAIATHLLQNPLHGQALLLCSLLACLDASSRSLAGILTDGRNIPELINAPGPLQRVIPLQAAPSPTDSADRTVSVMEHAIAQARENSRFGGTDAEPEPACLLVPEALSVHRLFAPGVEADWMLPAGHAPLGRSGSPQVAVRLLEAPHAIRVGLWSWSYPETALRSLVEQLHATLGRAVDRPGEPLAAPRSEAATKMQPAPAVSREEPANDTPRGEIEKKLAEIWSAVLQVPSVGRHEDFFDLGGHSLLAVRIGTRIERAFNREVPLNAILEKPTIAEFAALLEEVPEPPAQATALRRHRIVPIQEPSATALAPLFWIPGGRAISVLALREVSLLLGPDRPVYGVESRLPEEGEGFLSVPVRAQQYIDIVREKQPHGPYLLAGFCVGGMVAFEMAQQLRQQGEEVGFLGLLQASMPGFPLSPGTRRRMERQRRTHIARTVFDFLLLRVSPFSKRAPRDVQQAKLDRFAKLLSGWVGTSSQLPEATQETNGQTMKSYRPTTYPGAVYIFLAEDCFESAGIEAELDPRRAWITVAGPGSRIVVVPGDHVSMLTQAHARSLAEAMRAALPH